MKSRDGHFFIIGMKSNPRLWGRKGPRETLIKAGI